MTLTLAAAVDLVLLQENVDPRFHPPLQAYAADGELRGMELRTRAACAPLRRVLAEIDKLCGRLSALPRTLVFTDASHPVLDDAQVQS